MDDIALNIISSQYGKEKRYWMEMFSENTGFCNFINLKSYKNISNNPEELSFKITGESYMKVMKVTSASDNRLLIFLITAVTVQLRRYSQLNNITIGTTILNQREEGNFINTILPIKNELNGTNTFKELLIKNQHIFKNAIEHVNYPIINLFRELKIEGTESCFPLFDVAVVLKNIQNEKYLNEITCNFTFLFERLENHIECKISYNRNMYNKEGVKRLFAHFENLINFSLKKPNENIDKLDFLSITEKHKLLYDFNNTKADYPKDKTIHQLFEEQVEKTPNKTALTYLEDSITYVELNEKSNKLSWGLIDQGVQVGNAIGLHVEHSLEMVIGILGILKAGGCYLPIDKNYPEDRKKFVIADCGIKLILVDTLDFFKINGLKVLNLKDENSYSKRIINPPKKINPQSLAYIIYTSGSTGNPKGVPVCHRSVVNYISCAGKIYKKNNNLNFPLYSSLSFDLTVTSIFTPLLNGAIVKVYSLENNVSTIFNIIRDKDLGVLKLTPSHLDLISQEDLSDINIHSFVVGGEELYSSSASKIDSKITIYNEYGPTESTVGCIVYKYDSLKDKQNSVPIGRGLDNYNIYILDKLQNLVPIGVSGELCISGEGLAEGYINNPELTSEKFIDHPYKKGERLYKTGDLARWLPDGNIEFLGRIDHQVKIRGFRIELGEIESALIRHEYVKESVVLVREEKGDKYLCAYVVCTKGYTQEDLQQYLSTLLPDYMFPSYFVELDELPLTANGKVNRKALPSPDVKAGDDYVAPSNEIEEKLVGIWSEVLKIEKEEISISANFFAIGGHSLKAALLTGKIHKELDVEFSLQDVFICPTIQAQASQIEISTKNDFISIPKANQQDYYPLSSAQKRLYVLYEFNKESAAYNMPQIVSLGTELDRKRLKQVLEQLIMRHEALRTTFEIIENEVMQKITKLVSLDIEYFESTQEELNNLFQSFIRPFDLSKTPLFRVGLVKTENLENLMLIDMHHIIFDGISQKLMIKDFMSLYNNEKLDELKLQYKDYSEWQHSSKGKDEIKKQSDYWIKEFENGVPSLNIITDYERPQIQSFEGANLSFFINQEQSKRIKEFCQRKGVTEFMYFISIYTLLWNKILNKEKELFFGVGLSGRIHPDLQDVIGFFVNTLPFSIDVSSELTFVKLIENVKNKSFHLVDNQGCQFEDLIMKGELEKRNTKLPLYEVAFVWQNLDDLIIIEEESNLIDANSVMLDNQGGTSKFDILFSGHRYKDGFKINLNYSTKLFKESTIIGLKEIFCKIIENVTDDVNIPINSIDVFSKNVSSKLLEMEDENIIEDIDFTY